MDKMAFKSSPVEVVSMSDTGKVMDHVRNGVRN